MTSIQKGTRVAMLSAVLSLLAPVVVLGILLRRRAWRQWTARFGRVAAAALGEVENWRYDYTMHEFLTGEVKRSGQS